jgi:integration host factor subunit beta
MTKTGLIRRLADANPHLFRRDLERVIGTVLERISSALARGDRVELRGFGTFSTKLRTGRAARNPRTGKRVVVPDKTVLHFRAGKEMRGRLMAVDQGPSA